MQAALRVSIARLRRHGCGCHLRAHVVAAGLECSVGQAPHHPRWHDDRPLGSDSSMEPTLHWRMLDRVWQVFGTRWIACSTLPRRMRLGCCCWTGSHRCCERARQRRRRGVDQRLGGRGWGGEPRGGSLEDRKAHWRVWMAAGTEEGQARRHRQVSWGSEVIKHVCWLATATEGPRSGRLRTLDLACLRVLAAGALSVGWRVASALFVERSTRDVGPPSRVDSMRPHSVGSAAKG